MNEDEKLPIALPLYRECPSCLGKGSRLGVLCPWCKGFGSTKREVAEESL